MRWTEEQYLKYLKDNNLVDPLLNEKPKKNKFNNKITEVDGFKFDSKAEANRYYELKRLERAGIVSEIERQPKFLLQDGFKYQGKKYNKITYIADFMYKENDTGKTVVEDVKGVRTQVYINKMKMFLKIYGDKYDFREIGV